MALPPTLNLHHLRLFHAVAHDGTLTGAARGLNLSPSALSAQLRAFEDRLGHALFDRVGRGLRLTEAGHIALAHADAIFASEGALSATLARGDLSDRPLRVGALATLSRNFQMRFVAPLVAMGQGVVLRSGSQAELLAALADLSLDVVLTDVAPAALPTAASPGVPWASWQVQQIARQPAALIGTPARLAGLPGATLAGLLAAPLVLPAPGSTLRAGIDAMAARLGVVPRIAAEADDMAMLRLLARADAGLAVLPPIVVQDELVSGRLAVASALPAIEEVFLAVTLPRRFPHPAVATLCAAMAAPPDGAATHAG